jgi:hypothetical protein
MRSKQGWGIGLVVFGVLCLVAAAVLTWVVVPNTKQVPADTDTTRHFTGTGKLVLDPQAVASGNLAAALRVNVPVTAERTVKVLATDGDNAQVSDSRSLSTASGQPLGQTTAVYAVDRTSLQPATDPPATWQVVAAQGLTVSWPIGAEKKNYTGWVADTQATTTLTYLREESKEGVNTYVYQADVSTTPIKDEQVLGALPTSLPAGTLAALAGSLPVPDDVRAQLTQALPQLGDPVPLSYTYQATATYWVEPSTGIVVDTTREEIRKVGLSLPGGRVLPVAPFFDVTTQYTDQSVTDAADDAKDGTNEIQLYGQTLPLILLVVGVLVLLGGAALLVLGRRRGTVDPTPSGPTG